MRREVPSLFSVVNMGEIHKQAASREGAIACKRSRDSISALIVAVWVAERQGLETAVLSHGGMQVKSKQCEGH